MITMEFKEPSIKDGHLEEKGYIYSIKNGHRLFYALDTFISENGIDEFLMEVKDVLLEAKSKNEYAGCPKEYCYFNNDGKGNEIGRAWCWAVWQILVSMFGNYGVSLRGGWIEDIDGALEFIKMLKIKPCPKCGEMMKYHCYFTVNDDGKEKYDPKWWCEDCETNFDLGEGE